MRRLATGVARPLCRPPAARLARQISLYDGIVGELGLAAGGAWAAGKLSHSLSISGTEGIPEEGPVLVVSNHPGLADSISLFAAIPREDLQIVAAERAFLRALPSTSRYLIPVGEHGGRPAGLGSLRRASQHLRQGGALLTFPKAGIEPDPASMPGAEASLAEWRRNLDLFIRLTPEVTVVPAIVSGVISPAALASPVTRLRRLPEDRSWLAASLQMLIPTLRNVHTEVRFGHPVSRGDAGSVAEVREEILKDARRMIHLAGSNGHEKA